MQLLLKTKFEETMKYIVLNVTDQPTQEGKETGRPEKGLEGACALDNLDFFSFPEFHSCDVTHDILEAVLQLEVKLLLKSIVYEFKLISMDHMNNRFRFYNYGRFAQRNSPSNVNLDKPSRTNIGQKAAQMWTLGRYLL